MPVARPTFIDVRSRTNNTMATGLVSPRGLPSPRIAHFDGEIPPQMSPLDAFAAQSRLLAKQLDENKRDGRRVSRLPPLTIANSLANNEYMRSRSVGTGDVTPENDSKTRDGEATGNTPEVEEPEFRPKSFYPRMSGIPQADDKKDESPGPSPLNQSLTSPEFGPPFVARDYFGAPRAQSPEPVTSIRNSPEAMEPPLWVKPQRSFDSTQLRTDMKRGLSTDSTSSPKGQNNNTLAPPMSPQVRHAASIRSIPVDSSDDELSASTGGSSVSQHRKLSSSSGLSAAHSPLSPFIQGHGRSPSQTSELSVGGSRLARPTYNFSRPMSRGSRPSIDVRREPSVDNRPSMDTRRQRSFDSRPSMDSQSRQPSSDPRPPMEMMRQGSGSSQHFTFVDDGVPTPMTMDSDQFFDPNNQPDAAAPSYIYAKYSLPRGRMLQRDSKVLENNQLPRFEWAQPAVQSNVVTAKQPARGRGHTEPSPNGAGRPSIATQETPEPSPVEPSRTWPSGPPIPAASDQTRSVQSRPPPNPTMNETPSESWASTRSGSTIKPRPRRAVVDSMDLSAEDHLAKGIESHERGDVKESTYHFRLAAKQNLPTAMLLYALACRHGWGMRPNPQEAVQWLRKAADSASLEIADEKEASPADLLEQKTKRAQFALSIYELGVSHMNGWGTEQDKSLALRCFEIAANWGDADAMAEAGFCYTQGQGCKKDLKKAAKYYRMAEAKGMSMVGNSWIYKPKYADDDDRRQGRTADKSSSEKQPRDKSRTRTIFGRKKSVMNGAKS